MFATPAERMKAALIEYETLAECQHENVVQLLAVKCLNFINIKKENLRLIVLTMPFNFFLWNVFMKIFFKDL